MSKSPAFINIELGEPLIIGGAEVSTLKMRKPKAGDFRRVFTKSAADKLSTQQIMLNLAADLCGLAPEEFDELSFADMSLVIGKVEAFT